MTVRVLILIVCCVGWTTAALAEGEQQFAEFSECRLLSGESIEPCRVGYRTYGTLNDDKSNAILVPTWHTGTSADHAYLAVPDIIDPGQYFVILVDAFANGVSSSPSNSKRQANERFPAISITDMVDSQHRLLTEVFEIPSLHAIVGLSMGGMQAFEWSVRYPEFAARTVAVVSSPQLPTFDIALWTSNNRLLELYRQCKCREALEAIEAFGMTNLVPTKLEQEVSRTEALSTIVERGKARAKQTTIGMTWDRQRQAEAMIGHNIARDFGDDLERAAERIATKFLIIVGADDRIVTPQPSIDFAPLIDAQLIIMDEDCGHGAAWCAADEFSTLVRGFLDGS